MIIRLTQALLSDRGAPEVTGDVTSLLVMDSSGSPIVFILEQQDGTIFLKNASEDDFSAVLDFFGIKPAQYRALAVDT